MCPSLSLECIQIVHEALSREEQIQTAVVKGDSTSDLVTETDVAVEKFVIKELKQAYPDHQ